MGKTARSTTESHVYLISSIKTVSENGTGEGSGITITE